MGYSRGGRIASVFLTDHPERVRTAILGGTPWVGAEGRPALVLWANQLAESLEQGSSGLRRSVNLPSCGVAGPSTKQ